MSDWALSVDFGTSNTAAAFRRTGERAQSVEVQSGELQMPSCVAMDCDGKLLVGRQAQRSSAASPYFLELPKACLGKTAQAPGVPAPHQLSVVSLVAEVFAHVVDAAREAAGAGTLSEVILTHPVAWPTEGPRVAALLEAWRLANAEAPVRLVSEPVAATSRQASNKSARPGDRLAVVDFGGGTCDVAVLEVIRPGHYRSLAEGGDESLGGRALDRRMHRLVLDRIPEWAEIVRENPGEARTLEDQVRDAKEHLSSAGEASVRLASRTLTITRDEFEEAIKDEVRKVKELTARVLAEANTPPDKLWALYGTGGSSAVRAVKTALGELRGEPVDEVSQPKTVVALGAHDAARPSGPHLPTETIVERLYVGVGDRVQAGKVLYTYRKDGRVLPYATQLAGVVRQLRAAPGTAIKSPDDVVTIDPLPVVGECRVEVGQTVRPGDVLYEYSRGKESLTYKAPSSGVVREIGIKPGDIVTDLDAGVQLEPVAVLVRYRVMPRQTVQVGDPLYEYRVGEHSREHVAIADGVVGFLQKPTGAVIDDLDAVVRVDEAPLPPATTKLVEWLVMPGDKVKQSQPIYVLMDKNGDKVPVVAPWSGTVKEALVPVGGEVLEGSTVIVITKDEPNVVARVVATVGALAVALVLGWFFLGVDSSFRYFLYPLVILGGGALMRSIWSS